MLPVRQLTATLAMVVVLGLAAPDALAPEPPPPLTKKDLKEIASELERFWANRRSAPEVAEDALLAAEDRAIELWLPADHEVLEDVALARTYWMNRDRAAWLGDELKSPPVMYEAALRLRDPGRMSILFRHAWHRLSRRPPEGKWLSGQNLQLACDTAGILMRFGKIDEARETVTKALRASESGPGSDQPFLGLRFLDAKLKLTGSRRLEGWRGLEQVYEEARRTAEVPSGPNFRAWQIQASQEMVRNAVTDCDPARLEAALARAAQSEADLLLDAPQGLNDDLLRAMLADLPADLQLFAPLLHCGGSSPAVAERTFERILIRREAWRFRRTILGAAADAAAMEWEGPDLVSTLRSLIATRRLQAQIRLRVPDARLTQELANLPILENLSPPEGTDPVTNAWVQLSYAAGTLESILVDAAMPRWRKENATLFYSLLPESRRALPADGALVAYLELPEHVLVFVVDREPGVRWKLLDRDPVTVSSWISAASSRGARAARPVAGGDRGEDALREGGKALVDPIESFLQEKRVIFLLTDGALRLLPWQALVDRQGRYLGDRVSLRHVQSASDLFPSGPGDMAAGAGIVLVGPVYEPLAPESLRTPLSSRSIPELFSPLPGAVEEVESLHALLAGAGAEVRALRGREAAEAALWSLSRPRALHFAGHGFQVPRRGIPFEAEVGESAAGGSHWPMELENLGGGTRYRTGIALSDANRGRILDGPDGLLTASEVADLDLLGTELVVLSACETGSPVDEDPTGPQDLALAFRLAGAQSVVAGLWKVDDRATAMFMTAFYKALVEGKSVVAAAQSARGEVRRAPGTSDPFFWAGFEVFGEDVDLRAALSSPGTSGKEKGPPEAAPGL